MLSRGVMLLPDETHRGFVKTFADDPPLSAEVFFILSSAFVW